MSEVPLYAAEDVEPGGLMRRGLDSHRPSRPSGWVPSSSPPTEAWSPTHAASCGRLGHRIMAHAASSSPSKAARAPASPPRRGCWPSGCGASASRRLRLTREPGGSPFAERCAP